MLVFCCFGEPSGEPVFYFHGFPASRLEASLLDAAAKEAGVWLIAPDRPGVGGSTFMPGRHILHWSDDVAALADRLGLDRFRVLGGSAGCPYALACACRLPDRILGAAIVAGIAPADEPGAAGEMSMAARLGFHLARRRPWLFRLGYGALAQAVARHPALVYRLNKATPPDRQVLAQPEIRAVLDASIQEALRPGPTGALRELELLAVPWGFGLNAISVPVDVWHGESDGVVPPAMGRVLSKPLRRSRFMSVAGEGHVSLMVRRGRDILGELCSRR